MSRVFRQSVQHGGRPASGVVCALRETARSHAFLPKIRSVCRNDNFVIIGSIYDYIICAGGHGQTFLKNGIKVPINGKYPSR
jgi:hypothetical protein